MARWLRVSTPDLPWPHQTSEPAENQSHRTASRGPNRAIATAFVLVFFAVVQWAGHDARFVIVPPTLAEPAASGETTVATPAPTATPSNDDKNSSLPKNVAEMRDALLAAARSAKIEELRTPYEWNELPPAISDERVDDPIAYWKKLSRDGRGLEILMIIDKLLQLPPAKLNVGPDYENSALYVWPYFAELDPSKLTPRQQFEFRTLLPPSEARKIMQTKKWTWWRLAIGADGTWHSFMKHDN